MRSGTRVVMWLRLRLVSRGERRRRRSLQGREGWFVSLAVLVKCWLRVGMVEAVGRASKQASRVEGRSYRALSNCTSAMFDSKVLSETVK